MHSRRRQWGEALVAGALFLARPANAKEDRPPIEAGAVDLDWIAPAECPTRPYVLREVARLLGPALPSSRRAHVKGRAVLSRSEGGRFRVLITTFDEEPGERSMFGPSCHALADAIALVIALRVDPSLPDRPPPDSLEGEKCGLATCKAAPALVPTPVSPAAVPPPSPPAPAAKATAGGEAPPPETLVGSPAPDEIVPRRAPAPSGTPARAPITPGNQLALGASLVSSVGDLPALAVGGEAIAAWLHDRLRVELRGATALAQRADVSGHSGVGGTLQIVSGGLRGCYLLLVAGKGEPFGLAACAEGELDWMWVTGYGANPLSANAGWIALGGGLLARWNLGRGVALRASLDALAPLARPSFVVDEASGETALVHRPGIAFGRAGLGVEMHFF
jgi:hypothetical protein